jgi:hypothetical protein
MASAGAGLIHVAVMPAHWQDWIASGLFFAAVAVFQLMWAFLVWIHPRPLLLALGIAANAAAAGLWVASRTIGLPFGPHADIPESVEGAGICVLLLECYVIMGAGWAWLQDYEPEAVSRARSALVMLGANGVIAGTVCVGVAAGFQGHHDHNAPVEAQGGPRTDAAQHHSDATHQHGEPVPVPDGPGLPVTDMGLHIPGQDVPGQAPGEQEISLDGPRPHPGDHPHD